eukprot:jgi/Bigna1/82278/fgenesh1_pg.90_\
MGQHTITELLLRGHQRSLTRRTAATASYDADKSGSSAKKIGGTATGQGKKKVVHSHVKTLNLDRAIEAAGFSFEVYTDPEEAEGVWEADRDGNQIAYLSPTFVRDAFKGLLEVRLLRARGLPLVCNPFVKLNMGEIVARSESQGINLGGNFEWGSSERKDKNAMVEGDGEVFYFYASEPEKAALEFDLWTSSLTGMFSRQLGLCRCELGEAFLDSETHNITLRVASEELREGRLDIAVRWHPFSEIINVIDGVPLNIHDVSASGLKGLDVRGNVHRMDTASLIAVLRAWGLRTAGCSRDELVKKAQLAMKMRELDAARFLSTISGIVGQNQTLAMSTAVKNAASVFEKGRGLLRGDTFGAVQIVTKVYCCKSSQTALTVASKELLQDGKNNDILKAINGAGGGGELAGTDDASSSPWPDISGIQNRLNGLWNDESFQERLAAARDKAQKAAMAKIADGMGLTSRKEGSAWKMLLEAATTAERARGEYELCSFVENTETDTQGYVYRSKEDSVIWIAFRGTEQTKWRDIVTDMMITPREPEFATKAKTGTLRLASLQARDIMEDGSNGKERGVFGIGQRQRDTGFERGDGGYDNMHVRYAVRLHNVDTGVVLAQTEMKKGVSPRWENDLTARIEIGQRNLRVEIIELEAEGNGRPQQQDPTPSAPPPRSSKVISSIPLPPSKESSSSAMWYPIGGMAGTQIRFAMNCEIDVETEEQAIDVNTETEEEEKSKAERTNNEPPMVAAVHEGFLRAYMSIRHRILDTVEKAIMVDADREWRIYVTGHSLGGALATLTAYELATKYRQYGSSRPPSSSSSSSSSSPTSSSSSSPAAPRSVFVKKYSFGSPRVGNAAFARDFDETVEESWRIYNSKDVIPTVPRMLQYSHVKTGVMINSTEDALRLGATSRQDQQEVEEVDYVELATENMHKMSITEVLPSLSKVYESEFERLRMLADGSAIADHMEDLYFAALQKIILKDMLNS